MKKIILLAVIASAISVSGCTDTKLATWESYGKPHEISVYQFDKEIYHGYSTGKVQQSDHSIQFMDKDSHELVDISLGQSATLITKVMP